MEQIGDQPIILEAVACLHSRILQDPIIPASQVMEENYKILIIPAKIIKNQLKLLQMAV